MNHDVMKAKIYLYGDAETSAQDKREIEAHFAVCDECRTAFERWDKLQVALSQNQPRESADFVYRVMNRLEEQDAGSAQSIWASFFAPAAGYACALALIVSVLTPTEAPAGTDDILLANLPAQSQSVIVDEQPSFIDSI